MFELQFSKDFKNKKVKHYSKQEIEPHEIFLDRLEQEREDDVQKKIEVPLPKRNFLILEIIFSILFLVLFGKTFQFQILEGKAFLNLAEENKERVYQVQAPRGIIYDKEMRPLVWNKPAYDLVCDKRDFPETETEKIKVITEVAQILEMDPQLLLKKIEDSELSEVLISENLPHQVLVILETKITSGQDLAGGQGFRIEPNTVRDYIDPGLSHLIGYTRKTTKEDLKTNPNYTITDYIGKTGLEESYEKVLKGESKKILIEKDALGKERKRSLISQSNPGESLVLSLDFELQKKIIEELEKSLQRIGATSAVAIALDPKTGGVLSLVSLPTFDNNLFSQGISKEEWEELKGNPSRPLFNRAISGIGYPTGSVIKPLIGIAALEEGIITENTTIYCPLEICFWNKYLEKEECFPDWTFHGNSDVKRAIAESVNTFFYQVGGGYEDFEGLGPEKIIEELKLFNWGDKTGIDLPEEGKGILPKIDENWHLGDTYHLSIGQGPFTATPLEVAAAFSAIANGGKLFQPYLVQKITDSSAPEKIIKETKPKIIRENFVDSKNIEVVREGMRQAVTSGSAVLLNDLPVRAAAKTGTAESSKEGYYHHWVTVFAPYSEMKSPTDRSAEGGNRPYENPQIVLTIIVEDVKGIQSVTLPVAKEVLEWYFSHSSHEAKP